MREHELEPLLDGILFGEGPRWRDGRLFFSDIAAHAVKATTPRGEIETVLDLGPRRPSGLGWLPDGRLLVVSMGEHVLLRQDGDALTPVADFSHWCGGHANDMVVDARGRAYIGNLGFDIEAARVEPRATHVVRVDPDGSARSVADEMMCPNGMVITPDGETLIVAESMAGRLIAFRIAADGSLSGRRIFAELRSGVTPDGICLDAEGAVWLASPMTKEFLRVREGGEVTDHIACQQTAIACMLGGDDRRTLFAIDCGTPQIHKAAALSSGRIGTLRVDVPGAGLP